MKDWTDDPDFNWTDWDGDGLDEMDLEFDKEVVNSSTSRRSKKQSQSGKSFRHGFTIGQMLLFIPAFTGGAYLLLYLLVKLLIR